MKAYLAGGIFCYGDLLRNTEWAAKLRKAFPDMDLYSPVENTDINGVEGKKKFAGSKEIADADNKRLDNSVIANLAMFDLSALTYEKGYKQMENLLSDHSNQMVGRRMKQLLLTLYIRYTMDAVNTISVNTLDGIASVFNISKDTLVSLDNEYNIFWLQPFIRKAYNDIMFELNNEKQNSEQ